MPNKKTTTNKPKTQAAKQKPKLPTLSVKIDRLNDYEGSNIKAFASANIGGAYAIHGIKVVDGSKGLFVSMPSTSYTVNGETHRPDTFHPITAEAREDLNNAVLKAYEQELQNQQAEEQTDVQEETAGMSQNI